MAGKEGKLQVGGQVVMGVGCRGRGVAEGDQGLGVSCGTRRGWGTVVLGVPGCPSPKAHVYRHAIVECMVKGVFRPSPSP